MREKNRNAPTEIPITKAHQPYKTPQSLEKAVRRAWKSLPRSS